MSKTKESSNPSWWPDFSTLTKSKSGRFRSARRKRRTSLWESHLPNEQTSQTSDSNEPQSHDAQTPRYRHTVAPNKVSPSPHESLRQDGYNTSRTALPSSWLKPTTKFIPGQVLISKNPMYKTEEAQSMVSASEAVRNLDAHFEFLDVEEKKLEEMEETSSMIVTRL